MSLYRHMYTVYSLSSSYMVTTSGWCEFIRYETNAEHCGNSFKYGTNAEYCGDKLVTNVADITTVDYDSKVVWV